MSFCLKISFKQEKMECFTLINMQKHLTFTENEVAEKR